MFIVKPQNFQLPEPLALDCGKTLKAVNIRYETAGTLLPDRSNAVLITHALSGDAHVCGRHSPEDPKPGWWDEMIGPGKAIDTDRYFVICSNVLGSCAGSTGPRSVNPETGNPYNLDFPVITIRDMVRAQRYLIDYLGIEKLLAVVGGSMGGMQAMEWAINYPDRLDSAVPIATTSQLSPQSIAFDWVGREAIMAKVVIDATGDGDVAARAGAEYELGREGDHLCQPVTLMFRIGGVDYSKAIFPGSFETYIDVPKGEIQSLGKSILTHPAGHVLLYRTRIPGEVCVNMTNVINIDATDVRQLTEAEKVCRRQMDEMIPFLREYAPGYENCYLVTSASNVGVRETRHFKGLYTVTAEDILEARVFEDWIATRNYFNFDIHSLKGPGLDENGAQKYFRSKGAYTIPYRACVPVRIDSLLLSGRNISGTHKAHSNYRVMPICLNIGQGVGTAAAIAAGENILPRNVDVKKVQALLDKAGVKV